MKFIKKETLAQVFSCEFYEISKNTFFIEHLWWLLLRINSLKILYSLFSLYARTWGLSKYIETKLQTTCSYLIYTACLKSKKKRFGTSLPASFPAWFLKKNISLVYHFIWPNLNVWLHLLCEILDNMCIVILC